MIERAVPMIHVPNVRATVDWYHDIGFTVIDTYDNGGDGLSFAILSFGSSEVMFNQGGHPSTRGRREVDLYVYTDKVDELYHRLEDRVEVVEKPHDTFYGMREFIIRDLNGFWLTFAHESVFAKLMAGVRKGKAEIVRNVLDGGGLKPEALTVALDAASSGDTKNEEIAEILKNAGAVSPPEVGVERLQSYAGKYRGEQGVEFNVTFKDGKLLAAPGSQQPLSLIAIDDVTFRPAAFDNYGTVTFKMEAGNTVGCTLKHGDSTMQLKREEDHSG